MKIPIHDDFKIHFMERRSELLKGFVDTARSWRMVFLCCSPSTKADQADLDALTAEVAAFKDWAEKGLHEIRALGRPD